jgi:hypothetical protein
MPWLGGSGNDCQFRSGGRYLRLVLGFYNYYAVPTNFRALNPFYWHIMRFPVLVHHALLAALPTVAQPAAQADIAKMMRIAELWLPGSYGTP